jgi:hypothetical protein
MSAELEPSARHVPPLKFGDHAEPELHATFSPVQRPFEDRRAGTPKTNSRAVYSALSSSPLSSTPQTPLNYVCSSSLTEQHNTATPQLSLQGHGFSPAVSGLHVHSYTPESQYDYDLVMLPPEEAIAEDTEELQQRVRQRSKQIRLGLATPGYMKYRAALPKHEREYSNDCHPVTPRANFNCSKRQFDAILSRWRRMLHCWDNYDLEHDRSCFRKGGVTLGFLGWCGIDDQPWSGELPPPNPMMLTQPPGNTATGDA